MLVHAITLKMANFLGPGQFTITSVIIGVDRDLINVTYVQVRHVILDDY